MIDHKVWWVAVCFSLLLGSSNALSEQPSARSPSGQQMVQQARDLLREGNARQARGILEGAVRSTPRSAEAWGLLADSYAQLGMEGEALQSYDAALKIQPHHPSALYNSGILLLNRQRYGEAAQRLRTFHELRPRDQEVLLPLTFCLFQQGRDSAGLDALEEGLEAAKDSWEFQLRAGKILLNHGQVERAVGPLRRAFELRPNLDECRVALAMAESQLGNHKEVLKLLGGQSTREAPSHAGLLGSSLSSLERYEEAIPFLEKALRQELDNKSLYFSLALAYAASQRNEKALGVLQEAHRRWPTDTGIRQKLARFLISNGHPAEAAVFLSSQPDGALSPDDLELLVSCYAAMDRFEEAKRYAERAVSESGGRESAVLALANILQLEGRDPEVIDLLEARAPDFSGSARYIFTLGLSYYNNGNYSRAGKLFGETTSLDPGFAQAHYFQGSTLASMGKPDLAVAHYKDAVRLAPNNSLYHFQLGLVLSMTGGKEEAEEHLLKSVSLNGSHAPARYELAKLYADTSRDDLAREQLEEAIKVDEDFESSYYLLGQIYARQGRREDAVALMNRFQAIQRQRHKDERALKQMGSMGRWP